MQQAGSGGVLAAHASGMKFPARANNSSNLAVIRCMIFGEAEPQGAFRIVQIRADAQPNEFHALSRFVIPSGEESRSLLSRAKTSKPLTFPCLFDRCRARP